MRAAAAVAIGAALAAFPVLSRAEPPARGRNLDLPLAADVTTNPDWAEKPDADQMASHFPPLAQWMNLSGTVSMTCTVAVSGVLNDCKIVSEAPVGLGFGKATLDIASSFRLTPRRLDGAPVGDGSVMIPIRWQAPARDAAPERPPSPVSLDGRPPSAAALAAAKRLVRAMQPEKELDAQIDVMFAQVSRAMDTGEDEPHTAERAIAQDAIKASITGIAPRLIDRQAEQLAAHLSGPELDQAVAFFESPAGMAFTAEERAARERVGRDWADLWLVMADEARLRFCEKIACAGPASPPRSIQGARPARTK